MRLLLRPLGAALLGLGLAGLVVLAVGPRQVLQLEATRLALRAGLITAPPPQMLSTLTVEEVRELSQLAGLAPRPAVDAGGGLASHAGAPQNGAGQPPRRVRIARIRLDAAVVPARLVRLGSEPGPVTWEVPAHRVGHAQGTAATGEVGNMVLLGHVSSVNAGNVFAELEKVAVGDEVVVESDGAPLVYRVTEVRRVARDDMSVMAPTEGAVATLLTCIGAWLPDVMDYSHRLAVRAALVGGYRTG